jgi:hypothetical protein
LFEILHELGELEEFARAGASVGEGGVTRAAAESAARAR